MIRNHFQGQCIYRGIMYGSTYVYTLITNAMLQIHNFKKRQFQPNRKMAP